MNKNNSEITDLKSVGVEDTSNSTNLNVSKSKSKVGKNKNRKFQGKSSDKTGGFKLVNLAKSILTPSPITSTVEQHFLSHISVMKVAFRVFDNHCLDPVSLNGVYDRIISQYSVARGINLGQEDLDAMTNSIPIIVSASFEAYAALLSLARKYSCVNCKDINGKYSIGEAFSNDVVHNTRNLPTISDVSNYGSRDYTVFNFKTLNISSNVWANDIQSLFDNFYLTQNSILYCEDIFKDYIHLKQIGKAAIFLDCFPEYCIGDYKRRIIDLNSTVRDILIKYPVLRGVLSEIGFISLRDRALNVNLDRARIDLRVKQDDGMFACSVYNWPLTWLTSFDRKIRWSFDSNYVPDPYIYGRFTRSISKDSSSFIEYFWREYGQFRNVIHNVVESGKFPKDMDLCFKSLDQSLTDTYNDRNTPKTVVNPEYAIEGLKFFFVDGTAKVDPKCAGKWPDYVQKYNDNLNKIYDERPNSYYYLVNSIESLVNLSRYIKNNKDLSTLVGDEYTKYLTIINKIIEISDDKSIKYIDKGKKITEFWRSVGWTTFINPQNKGDYLSLKQIIADVMYYSNEVVVSSKIRKSLRANDEASSTPMGSKLASDIGLNLSLVPFNGKAGKFARGVGTAFTFISEGLYWWNRFKEETKFDFKLPDFAKDNIFFPQKKDESDRDYVARIDREFVYRPNFAKDSGSTTYSLKYIYSEGFDVTKVLTNNDREITLNDFAICDRFRLLRPTCHMFSYIGRTKEGFYVNYDQSVISGGPSNDPDHFGTDINDILKFINTQVINYNANSLNMYKGVYIFSEESKEGEDDVPYTLATCCMPGSDKQQLEVVEDMNSIDVSNYDFFRDLCQKEIFYPNTTDYLAKRVKLSDIKID